MAYSIQREVSDGTLVLLDISISYIDREEISVLFDGVVQVKGDTWDWVGTVGSKLSFTPAVGNGVEVSVVRQTDTNDLRHRFSEGAAFTANSMDEALEQVLHIAQEAAEQLQGTDFYNDLDMHGYRVKNVGDGVAPGDAANVGQMIVHDATIVGYRDQTLIYRNDAEGFADDAETSAILASTAALKHTPTGQFFSGLGARVNRIADRAFFGDAVLHDGADSVPQADWLTQYELARGRVGGSLMFSTGGITNGAEPRASNTFMVGSQAKYLNAGYNAIALRTLAANNSTLSTVHAYAGYFEAYRNAGAAGGAYGLEIDTINYEGVVNIDPYQQGTGQTIALQIAGGAEYPEAGQFASSAAINVRNNGSTYSRGIVFGCDALTGATGSVGTAPALVLGKGHQIMWFGGVGEATSSIECLGTTSTAGVKQRFVNDAVNFLNSNAKPVFQIGSGASYVNYLAVRGSSAGNAIQISANGDDANIDLQLLSKGLGLITFGTYTAGALSPAGYISIRDTGGTVRRLLVG